MGYLRHILEAIDRNHRYVEGRTELTFLGDERTQDAVVRNFEILGEAAHNVELHHAAIAAAHADVPWALMYTMRNRIADGECVQASPNPRAFFAAGRSSLARCSSRCLTHWLSRSRRPHKRKVGVSTRHVLPLPIPTQYQYRLSRNPVRQAMTRIGNGVGAPTGQRAWSAEQRMHLQQYQAARYPPLYQACSVNVVNGNARNRAFISGPRRPRPFKPFFFVFQCAQPQ